MRTMRRTSRRAAFAGAGLILTLTATATAGPETRTLRIYHVNLHESSEVTFKRDGKYIPDGLKKANWALRDWRRNQPTTMDPRLLDLLWEAYQKSGSRKPIYVLGGFRAPETNKMLRSRSAFSGVAEHSQHMLGKAVDFFIPDVPLSKLREIGLKMQIGGVGYYPHSGAPFVHFDVGKGRYWPRMSRQDLVRIFPNGGTIHLPADGKPLPGYEMAMASYNKRKGASELMVADAGSQAARPGRSFLARLFGGGQDEIEDTEDSAAPAAKSPAPARKTPEPQIEVAAARVPPPTPARTPARGSVAAMPDANAFDASAPAARPAAEETQVAALLPARVPVPSAAPGRPAPAEPAIEPALVAALEETDAAPTQLAYAVPTPHARPAFEALAASGAQAAIAADSPEEGELTPESIIASAMLEETRTPPAPAPQAGTGGILALAASSASHAAPGGGSRAGSMIVAALDQARPRPPEVTPSPRPSPAGIAGREMESELQGLRGGRVGGDRPKHAARSRTPAIVRPAPPRDEIAMLIADPERRAIETHLKRPASAALVGDRPAEILAVGFTQGDGAPSDIRHFAGKAVRFLPVRKLN